MIMKIKGVLLLAIFSLCGACLSAERVFATSDYGLGTAANTAGLTSSEISKKGDIPTILGYVVSIVLALVGVYFFLLILYAGIIWMTAAGSSEKVTQSKNKMISAVIGLVIVLSAYTITRFVFDIFVQDPTAYCKTTPDGVAADEAGAGQTCLKGKLVSECDYVFKEYGGKCTPIAQCKGRIFSGLCPGGIDEKCCLPSESVTQWTADVEKGAAVSDTANKSAPTLEKNACENEGNFCASKTTCEGLANGKSLGQNGCGTGQICCKNCLNSLGGNCVSDETKCVPDGAIKRGYCYGAFIDKVCCTGKSLE